MTDNYKPSPAEEEFLRELTIALLVFGDIAAALQRLERLTTDD